MDRSTDCEMPSPKRIRLEAPAPGPALDPATPVDDMDEMYGTPPISPAKRTYVHAPALGPPAFAMGQKLFQLPGLGMLNGDPPPSIEVPQLQSQPSSILEAQQRSSTGDMEDVEQENEEMLQVNGGLDAVANGERIIDIQTTERRNASPTASEILVEGNDIGSAKREELASEIEAPFNEDVTRSGPELGQIALDWHSSGTVVDERFQLYGHCSIKNLLSTGPDSNTARGAAYTEILQDKDVYQNGDNIQEDLVSEAKSITEQSEKKITTEPTFEELAKANKDIEEAEFELDSSALGSDSSSDDSTDTSSSDDSDADDYEMLSPAEQARRLMAEDGGSDDDGKGKGRKAVVEVPRTLNEKPEELVPKPTVAVTEDMRIEELGLVENTIENLALIKANTSGEYQVLESGSLLCLQDRSVIGVVSETLGRVQQPYYCVRFTNATAIAEAGIEKDTKIFYVAQHSTTVFTQPLKAFKGSDASNLHDEEVGDDELEFSDDEAEAEHKREVKQHRMAKRNARDGQPDGFSRGPQQRPSGPGPRLNGGAHPVQEHPPNSTEAALNYDDTDGMNADNNEDEDGLYTPLARPSNLHEILSGKTGIPANRGRAHRGGRGDSRGGSRGRGRGDNRGRGGDRGMRGSDRGKQNRKDHGNRGGQGHPYGHASPPTPQNNSFGPPQNNGLPPRPPPETVGYRSSTHPGNGFTHPPLLPQQSPIPSPAYQTQQPQQPQSHSHQGYPAQYYNPYNQSYPLPPQHQSYASQNPQQNYSQYHQSQQSISRQGYLQPFATQPSTPFPLGPQYPPQQTPQTPSIPPGAHINPNFFRQQGQSSSPQSSSPQGWQQGYNQQQQASPASNGHGTGLGAAAPGSNAANLQELLRGLGRGGDQSR